MTKTTTRPIADPSAELQKVREALGVPTNGSYKLSRKSVFPFGKYRGCSLGWACEAVPGYVVWWAANIKKYPIKKKWLKLARQRHEQQQADRLQAWAQKRSQHRGEVWYREHDDERTPEGYIDSVWGVFADEAIWGD